jgi:hypothetical protein
LSADFKIKLKKLIRKERPIRFDLKNIPPEYNIEIQNKFEILMAIQEEMTPDELANHAENALVSSAKNVLPRRENKRRKYITDETLRLIEERRKIKPKRHAEGNDLYKEYSRKIRRMIRRDKTQHILDTCNKIDQLNMQRKDGDMFKEMRILTAEFRPSFRVINDKHGNALTQSDEILERWKEYCKEMYEDVNNITDDGDITEAECEPEPLLEEVRWAIKGLKHGKSPGCDEIPAELIQAGGEASVHIYHALCVKIWKSGKWPKEWKRSVYVPIPKSGDPKLCTNYRTIALISHASKILLRIIMERLEKKLEEEINIAQAGFRKCRGTRDHIFNMRIIIEKCREYNVNLHTCFIDYTKAFDCVQHQTLWRIMLDMGFPTHIVHLIKSLYQEQQAAVRTESGTSDWFEVQKGVRQGCILSPCLFNIYAENIMRNVKNDPDYQKFDPFNIGGHDIPELRYADDTVLLSNSPEGLEKLILSVKKHSEEQNLLLNAKKTKTMTIDKAPTPPDIGINCDNKLESVNRFEYLGSLITNNGDCSEEIRRRLAIAAKRLAQLKNVWKSADKPTKIKFLRTCIFPIATYGCETWTITQTAERRITAFEMRCYRRALRISWIEKRSNNDILEELNICEKWLLNTIKSRKLTYFGHVKRHDGLERTIMEGMVPGRRGRGRPRRRWTQDIKDTLGISLTEASTLAKQREDFRLAVKKATFGTGQATR